METAINAVADIFRWIPVKVRQVFYGLLGLVVLTNYIFEYLPEDQSGRLLTAFGVLATVMALANTSSPPLPPPPEFP